MAEIKVKCVHCSSTKTVKFDKQTNGTPRYKCQKCNKLFQAEYLNNGSKPETKDLIIQELLLTPTEHVRMNLALEAGEFLMSVKKTKTQLTNINPKYQNFKKPLKIRLEMDKMWSRVYSKKTPCWLWHAINHDNGEIVAYVFGTREHEMLWKLFELLSNLNIEIETVYSDNNFAYHDAISRNVLQTHFETVSAQAIKSSEELLRYERWQSWIQKTFAMSPIFINFVYKNRVSGLKP